MKATELIKDLQEIVKTHGDQELIFSIDDEGNEFKRIYPSPTVGHCWFEDGDFVSIVQMHGEDSDDYEALDLNAICVN